MKHHTQETARLLFPGLWRDAGAGKPALQTRRSQAQAPRLLLSCQFVKMLNLGVGVGEMLSLQGV